MDATDFSSQPRFSNPTDQPRTSIGAAARGGAVSRWCRATLDTLYRSVLIPQGFPGADNSIDRKSMLLQPHRCSTDAVRRPAGAPPRLPFEIAAADLPHWP
jgi:hypothetical protein